MTKMKDIREKYVFSERCAALRAGYESRKDDVRISEGTFTFLPDDGKTPFEDIFERYPDDPYVINLARGIVESWMVTDPVILPRDYLIGYPRPMRPVREHFSWGIQIDFNSDVPERVEKLRPRLEPLNYEHMDSVGVARLGEEAYGAAKDGGLWWTGGYQGHTIPNFGKLLTLGVGGVVAQIDHYDSLTDDKNKKEFYEACRILMLGFSEWIKKHADCADALADKADSPRDAAELRAAAANARRVAWDKPTDMYGACQLTWFYALWDTVDSQGRTDQYLAPFYSGEADDDYVVALTLKFCEFGVHHVTVGGVKPDGTDATNEISYLMLQALRTMHEIHPRMSIRVHDGTPRELVDLAVLMWSEGMSDPTLAGDDTVISGLTGLGVSLEDARDYSILGCQEVEVPGKSNFGCEDGSINLAKILEYTLNHGRDRFTGVKVGLDLGGTEDYDTFDKLWDAFSEEVRYFTGLFTELCNLGAEIRAANVAKLVKSPMTDACIERGLNLDAGGAVYNYGVVETAGHAAVADSLYAMKKLVYDEKKISLSELEAALASDFEGHEDTRRLLLGAPKFGNNDEGSDAMAAFVLNFFWDEIAKYKSGRGDVYSGACALLEGGISYGRRTWALPDGRHTGEPLGNTIGPRTGSDKNGLTAMLSSVAKLPLKKGVGGTTCNVLVPTTETETEEQRANIASLMRTFLKMGGQLAQMTTATKEDMLDAQLHPEKHEDLLVRVGGYSAKFNCLGCDLQNEIIARYA